MWPQSLTHFSLFCLLSRPALGLVPALALTLRPTETIPPGIIRTTEAALGATTEAIGGLTTTAAETEATTNEAITRTGAAEEGAAAMAIRQTGRVEEEVEGAGTIVTMTRITTHTAPRGGAHAHAHQGSAQVAAAAHATLTALLQGGHDAPGAPATPHGLALGHHVTVAAKERARRTEKTS